MEIFNSTLTQMFVMFSFIIIGFVLKKKKLLPKNSATVLSKLENYVLVPALVLDTFMTYCRVDSLKENYNLILYCLLLLAVGLCIAIPLSKPFSKEKSLTEEEQKYRRNIYKYALTFGNFSFLGNAVVLAVLGDKGLFHYLLFTLPLNVAVYTWGIIILIPEGNGKKSALKNLLNPVFVSLIAGLVLAFIPVLIMKGQLKSVHMQSSAGGYEKRNTRKITVSRDTFLYHTVNRVPRPKENSNRSGGSSTFHGSSGRSHGGRGGGF